MAERKKKKADTAQPTTVTAGGKTFVLIPSEQWTPEQEDRATAMILRIGSKLQGGEDEDSQEKMMEIVASLVESGTYRDMLGLCFWPDNEAFDPNDIPENIAFFRAARIPFSERVPAAMAAVTAFFGSTAS